MRKNLPLHPFIFAIYPILFLFSYNIYELSYSDLTRPLSIALVSTCLLLLFLRLILRDSSKSGVIVSLSLILFFSYGHIANFITKSGILGVGVYELLFSSGVFRSRLFFLSAALLLIVFINIVHRSNRDFKNLSRYLNYFSVILILIPISNIVLFEVTEKGGLFNKFSVSPEVRTPRQHDIDGLRPDIYYIILDSYARADTLERIYDYNNSPFIESLTAKGFYVANQSRSNYVRTLLSLPSALNMMYVNNLSDVMGANSQNVRPLINLLEENEVVNFLRERGYVYVFFTSGPFNTPGQKADIEIKHELYLRMTEDAKLLKKKYLNPSWDLSDFEIMLIQKTPLRAFGSYEPLDPYMGFRKKIIFYLNKLTEMPDIREPTFVFVHLPSPHPPFVFGRDGEFIENTREFSSGDADDFEGSTEEYIEGYRNQLHYLNVLVENAINGLLSKSESPPIIILQADHGPVSTLTLYINKTDIEERISILNAYYLPYSGDEKLYSTISPVNSFRVIFNHYFNTSYALLDDKSYFTDPDYPYDFTLI